jgi:hypothetical protein
MPESVQCECGLSFDDDATRRPTANRQLVLEHTADGSLGIRVTVSASTALARSSESSMADCWPWFSPGPIDP